MWLLARRDERAGWRARSARDRRLSRLVGRVPRRPLRHVDPEPLVHLGGVVGGPRGHPTGVGRADRPPAGRAHPPPDLDRHRSGAGRHARCSPGSTCRSRPAPCSATCWRWSAACWPRPTSPSAARCGSACPPCPTRWPATPRAAVLLLGLCLVSSQELARLRRGHVAGDRRPGGRRPAPRPHAGQPRAAQHQPHGGVRRDPLRDPRRHADRPGRLRGDAAGRRPGRPLCSSAPEWWSSLRSDQDAEADLVDPGGLLT